LRPVLAFLALVPFVIPPIVLVVGLLDVYRGTPAWFYAEPWGFLAAAYVILAFPYMFFALDAGFRAIDVHTLTEAAQSLGARWPTTLVRVILPNIRAAALGGAFLTLATVMGEYTIASLAAFHTFPTYMQYINETKAYEPAALALTSFGITWAAMLLLLAVGRGRQGRPAQLAGARRWRFSTSAACAGRSGRWWRSTASRSRSSGVRSCRCSARPAAGRRRPFASWPGSTARTRARCSSTAGT